ncbi:MAG: zinc-binding dehydrogenase [Candidatus Dormibacteraeota bacterium]|nr:zinc-binding dehydrogenase [Candidatus Dormibacteraeota bacterium]
MVATRLGGPEVLEIRDLPEPQAGPGEVLLRVHRAGVNFADLASTRGTYAQAPPPPFVPGLEVSGHEVRSGRPVIAIVPSGGYAEVVAADERFVWDAQGMNLDEAGGYPLVALTAYYALRHVARLGRGETVLITAAAGGVGSAAIQVARALGAGRVVGVASTDEKQERVRQLGADEAVGYQDALPGPVDVMVDMVGGDIFRSALKVMAPFGRMVCIGSTSGQVQEIPPVGELRVLGVGVLPFSMGALRARHPDLYASTVSEGLELMRSGAVRPPISQVLPLAEAATAHRLLAGRSTMGKLLLAI